MADATKRMNYFDRQFLRTADFQDEQTYHVDRRRRHNTGFHSIGVAQGLQVVASGVPNQVNVQPGWAVDALGREIVLAAPRNNVPTGGTNVEIWISYPDPEPLTDPSTDPGVTGFTRVSEEPVVTVVPPGTVPANAIRLATVSAAGVIDNSARPLAGLIDNSVTSAKIAEADGTTGQNTNIGSGVKEGHIQNLAVSAIKLRFSASDVNDAQRAVTTNHIRNLNVTEPKLADNAVSTRTIADNAVTSPKIADGSVGTAELANGAVTEDKLADNVVTSAKIADRAITQAKVAQGSISIGEMKATLAAEGTVNIDPGAVQLIPPVAVPSGFYISDISITNPAVPGTNLRISWQEEYVVFRSPIIIIRPNIGRQWRITNTSQNPVTVAFRIFRIDET